MLQRRALLVVALCALLCSHQAHGQGWLDSVTNALGSAADSVGNALNTATDAVSDATNTAVNAVGDAAGTATDAVRDGVGTAVRGAQHAVDVSEDWISNTAVPTVVNFTQDQWDAASGLADDVGSTVSSATGEAVNVARSVGGDIRDTGNSIVNRNPAPEGIDATNPAAIQAAFAGPGFGPVAVGILSALQADLSPNVADAFAAVVVNASSNETVQIQVAQAFTAAMGIAENSTEVTVNSTQVAEVFLASLQNAIVQCSQQLQPGAAPGTEQFVEAVAANCCTVVDRTLDTGAMVADLIGVEEAFYTALGQSDRLGNQPQLDLTRCLSAPTDTA